jgi:hypothetical protein
MCFQVLPELSRTRRGSGNLIYPVHPQAGSTSFALSSGFTELLGGKQAAGGVDILTTAVTADDGRGEVQGVGNACVFKYCRNSVVPGVDPAISSIRYIRKPDLRASL